MTDHVKDQLCARIEELEKEKLELNEQLDALQQERVALAAPVVQGEPVAFRYRTSGSAMWNYVDWRGPDEVEKDNFEIQYLSAAPQPAEQQQDVAGQGWALKQILGWRELRSGREFPIERIEDIARAALDAYRKGGDV